MQSFAETRVATMPLYIFVFARITRLNSSKTNASVKLQLEQKKKSSRSQKMESNSMKQNLTLHQQPSSYDTCFLDQQTLAKKY
jgi:hypothetical protein